VPRIGFQKLEVLVGQFTNRFRQVMVVKPELLRSEMLQSGVQRPAS